MLGKSLRLLATTEWSFACKMKTYKYQEAYAERNNLVSKTYKLNKDTVDEFKATCEANGVSQASKLQELMQEYIRAAE